MKNLFLMKIKYRITKLLGEIMEIKYNQRSYNYPSIIKGLIHEISKKDFDHFQIGYSDDDNYADFFKNDDTLIEFREDHIKETCENGDVIYWNYANICKIKVAKDIKAQNDEEDVFDDNDLWTGNRIQF